MSLTQSGPTVSIAATAEAGMEGEVCVLQGAGLGLINPHACTGLGREDRDEKAIRFHL